jgi:glycogen debranching enzyme
MYTVVGYSIESQYSTGVGWPLRPGYFVEGLYRRYMGQIAVRDLIITIVDDPRGDCGF